MGAIATLSLDDGQATPVAHSFEPTRAGETLATYHDKVDGIMAGYPSVSIGNRFPTQENGNYKVTLRVKIPVLETAATAASGFTPGPTVAYVLSGNMDFIIPARATEAERDDLLAYCKNLLAHTVVDAVVVDMDPPY
jgi:hypothetical protein